MSQHIFEQIMYTHGGAVKYIFILDQPDKDELECLKTAKALVEAKIKKLEKRING